VCVCYFNVFVQYFWVNGYSFVCVNLLCWCGRFVKGLLLCVYYFNVFLQFICVQGSCCLCVTLMCFCSTVVYNVTILCRLE